MTVARVTVVEPSTGVPVEVESDSPLAKLWEKADQKKPEPKSPPAKRG